MELIAPMLRHWILILLLDILLNYLLLSQPLLLKQYPQLRQLLQPNFRLLPLFLQQPHLLAINFLHLNYLLPPQDWILQLNLIHRQLLQVVNQKDLLFKKKDYSQKYKQHSRYYDFSRIFLFCTNNVSIKLNLPFRIVVVKSICKSLSTIVSVIRIYIFKYSLPGTS